MLKFALLTLQYLYHKKKEKIFGSFFAKIFCQDPNLAECKNGMNVQNKQSKNILFLFTMPNFDPEKNIGKKRPLNEPTTGISLFDNSQFLCLMFIALLKFIT